MCGRFWWGSKKESRKIHWCSWDRLCVSKYNGGMGFRDLSVFNRALIAKQCWLLVSNPNSLAVRVLKNYYFHASSFLNAKDSCSGSLIWKNFLWGHNILVSGSRWRIGTSSSIYIYDNKWIPRLSSFKIFSHHVWLAYHCEGFIVTFRRVECSVN